MVTQRRAPGPGELGSSVQALDSLPGPIAPVAPMYDAPERRDPPRQVVNDIALTIVQTLDANIDRGLLSEERFRQIAETLDDVVFLTSANLDEIQFVSAAYEKIWGRSRAELYQNPLAFLDGVHADDRERVRDAVTCHPGCAYDVEFRVIRAGGEVRWVWSRGFPVANADGKVSRIAGIAEDITDRKRIVASHEQLIRGFTHDVKNPLGAADGHLALLQEGVLGDLSALQKNSVDRARLSIHTAIELVAQLLDIERAQTGTLPLHRESFDLAVTIREVVDEHRAAASAKQITVTLELTTPDRQSLFVYSDRTRIRQIVTNLVSNAVKYTQAGGRCTIGVRFVQDTAFKPARWIAVSVADNGPGIPSEKQHLVFREFTRFSSGSAEGSGIGLAISQRLAHALDANITFESTPGIGSTFTLWLPQVRQ